MHTRPLLGIWITAQKNHLGRVLQSVREDLVRDAVHLALIEPDSHRDVNFPSSAATDEHSDISIPLLINAHSECDNHSVRTLDELIEHSHELPPPSLSTPLPFPTQPVPSPQPTCSSLPSETVHVESSEQKIVVDVMPSQNVTVPSRIIKKTDFSLRTNLVRMNLVQKKLINHQLQQKRKVP